MLATTGLTGMYLEATAVRVTSRGRLASGVAPVGRSAGRPDAVIAEEDALLVCSAGAVPALP